MPRHSGASIDRSRHYRSQLDVQKRGHWKTAKSAQRYEKSARLARSWEMVPQRSKDYCLKGEVEFAAVVLGLKKAPMVQLPRRNRKGCYIADLFSHVSI